MSMALGTWSCIRL